MHISRITVFHSTTRQLASTESLNGPMHDGKRYRRYLRKNGRIEALRFRSHVALRFNCCWNECPQSQWLNLISDFPRSDGLADANSTRFMNGLTTEALTPPLHRGARYVVIQSGTSGRLRRFRPAVRVQELVSTGRYQREATDLDLKCFGDCSSPETRRDNIVQIYCA